MAATIISIPDPFDPTTETLRQFITRYENAGKKQGKFKDSYNRKTGKTTIGRWPYASILLNSEGIKEYLDRPVIDILRRDTLQNTDTGYNKAVATPTQGKTEVPTSRISNIRSAMDAIHSNVIRQIERIDPSLKVDLVNPRDHIIVPKTGTEGKSRAADIKINPYKLGEYFVALEDHAKANPTDAPAIRAFLFGLNTGARPDEFSGITSESIIDPVLETGRTTPSLYIPVSKTTTEINAPMSPMALSVLDAQTTYNNRLNQKGIETPYVFTQTVTKSGKQIVEPITSSDITKVIAKIKVPGVFFEVTEDGRQVPMDGLTEAYDLRRINATIYDIIPGVSRDTAAGMKGRDIKGGGKEGAYVATAAGLFPPEFDEAVLKLNDFLIGQYTRALESVGRLGKGQVLASTAIPTDLPLTDEGKVTYPTGAPKKLNIKTSPPPKKLSMPDVSVERAEGTSTIAGGPQEIPEPTDAEKLANTSDTSKSGFRKLARRGRVLGPVAALTGASFMAGSERAEAEGAGTAGQIAAGALYTGYDLLAPMTSLAAEPGQLAGPKLSEATPEMQAGAIPETEFTRAQEISAMDARQAAIDEQMARIQAYDDRQAQTNDEGPIEADIEIIVPKGE